MDGTPTPPETRCCCYVQRDRCGCGTPSARCSDGCSTNRRAGRELLCRPPDQVLAHPIHLRLPPFSKKAIRASRGKYINAGRVSARSESQKIRDSKIRDSKIRGDRGQRGQRTEVLEGTGHQHHPKPVGAATYSGIAAGAERRARAVLRAAPRTAAQGATTVCSISIFASI